MPTNNQFERSRRTPPAPRSGSGQRGLSASHATRLSFRIGPEHWLLAGVVCCAVLILSGVRAFAPSLADEARTPSPVAINVQALHRARAGSHRLRQGPVHLPCSVGKRRFCEACPGSPGKYRAKCGRHGLQGGPRPAHLPHAGGAGAGDRRRQRGDGQGPGRVSQMVQGSRRLHHRPHPCQQGQPAGAGPPGVGGDQRQHREDLARPGKNGVGRPEPRSGVGLQHCVGGRGGSNGLRRSSIRLRPLSHRWQRGRRPVLPAQHRRKSHWRPSRGCSNAPRPR